MSELLHLSGLDLARKIKDGSISSQEVVEVHIQQIQKVNTDLNCLVFDRFEQARKEAKAADQQLKRSTKKLPLFHGVPCTIKECFSVQGMPNSAGIWKRKTIRSSQDATTVTRLKKAGAIPLGVTNTSEVCMWFESNNTVYGRSKNPYDLQRTVGGSSGGEGGIIAAGGSPFGLGSDVGGSIRMPAFFNGIYGHKPSGGLVPCTGQFPPGPLPQSYYPAFRYLTTGPLSRKACDLMPLLKIIAGPDEIDHSCLKLTLSDPSAVDIRTLKILNIPNNQWQKVSTDLQKAQNELCSFLQENGAEVQNQIFPLLKKSLNIWSAMLNAGKEGNTSYKEYLGMSSSSILALLEYFKWALGMSHHTFPAIGLAATENIPSLFKKSSLKNLALGKELKNQFLEAFKKFDLILFPSFPSVAPKHNTPFLRPFDFVYTAIFNVMEFPVTQVPLGLNSKGVPLGIQIVAPHGQDHRSIALAEFLEKTYKGWTPPKDYLDKQKK